VTCKLTFPRVPLVLALLVALATSPALANKGNKPPKDSDTGDDDGTVTITTPVRYVLDMVPVEGFLPFPFSANSLGEVLYQVNVSEVAEQDINTDATSTAAVVDINTGQVNYIDNLLTKPTMWTELRPGVDSVQFLPRQINRNGDVVGGALETIDGQWQPIVGFLLKRIVTSDGKVAYQPFNLGVSSLGFLNDVGEIYGQDLKGYFIGYFDVEYVGVGDKAGIEGEWTKKLYMNELGLPREMGTAYDLNNTGTFFGSTITDPQLGRDDFVLDIDTGKITYITGFFNVRGESGQSLSDSGAMAGSKRVYYEYTTKRNKTSTATYEIPAVVDPEFGLQSYDNPDRTHFTIVTMNHQRLNGESSLLAYTSVGDGTRKLWVKLPGKDPFFAHDSLSAEDQAIWQGVVPSGKEFARLLTPLNLDGSVNHSATPSIIGPLVTGSDSNGWIAPGFWVLRPAP
jgi:hypothetical protein